MFLTFQEIIDKYEKYEKVPLNKIRLKKIISGAMWSIFLAIVLLCIPVPVKENFEEFMRTTPSTIMIVSVIIISVFALSKGLIVAFAVYLVGIIIAYTIDTWIIVPTIEPLYKIISGFLYCRLIIPSIVFIVSLYNAIKFEKVTPEKYKQALRAKARQTEKAVALSKVRNSDNYKYINKAIQDIRNEIKEIETQIQNHENFDMFDFVKQIVLEDHNRLCSSFNYDTNIEFRYINNNVLGMYDFTTNTITISSLVINKGSIEESLREALDTLRHEYQHALQYLYGTHNIMSEKENKKKYENRAFEKDAFNNGSGYAKQMVKFYMEQYSEIISDYQSFDLEAHEDMVKELKFKIDELQESKVQLEKNAIEEYLKIGV